MFKAVFGQQLVPYFVGVKTVGYFICSRFEKAGSTRHWAYKTEYQVVVYLMFSLAHCYLIIMKCQHAVFKANT